MNIRISQLRDTPIGRILAQQMYEELKDIGPTWVLEKLREHSLDCVCFSHPEVAVIQAMMMQKARQPGDQCKVIELLADIDGEKIPMIVIVVNSVNAYHNMMRVLNENRSIEKKSYAPYTPTSDIKFDSRFSPNDPSNN